MVDKARALYIELMSIIIEYVVFRICCTEMMN